nr:syntaxin-51-like [Ipomoea batatas]
MTMEPWAFRSAFGDSWYSDVFARETDALTKVLQKSLSTPPQAAAAFPGEMVFSVAVPETTPVQTHSASGPTGSGGSENETAGSKRRNVGPSGKITKRKSRAAKRATTTYKLVPTAMASSSDSWTREFNDATKLSDEINSMIKASPPSGPETQRHFSAARRKVTILRTRLDTLQSLLSKLQSTQPLFGKRCVCLLPDRKRPHRDAAMEELGSGRSKKEMKRRHDMLDNLVTKANQMATALNMNTLTIRDSLLGPETKQPDVVSRATGLDNQGLVSFQRQVMKEQDDDLGKLEESVLSTKHVALAINEELNLHTGLLDSLDHHVETTNTRLQRVQRRLAMLNKRTKGGCTWLFLLVIFIVILIVGIFAVIKYL